MSAIAPEQKISMRDFITQLGFTRDADNIQAVCYHSEIIGDGKPHLAEKDIEELLVAAKVPRPVELSEKVESLVIRRRLNLIIAAPPRTDNFLARLSGSPSSYVRYSLTNQGVDFIHNRMEKVGLALTKPTERTELIKEITESLHGVLLANGQKSTLSINFR
jgi:hypothetical protein